jgi:3-hydroxyacyl-[acyl-carrier-protein] dehydratase
MLRDKLYSFGEIRQENDSLSAQVKLKPEHSIFEGHFPGTPVLPGVCMMEIFRDACSFFRKGDAKIQKISEIKYPAMLVPSMFPEVELKINLASETEDVITLSASISSGDTVFMKIRSASVLIK